MDQQSLSGILMAAVGRLAKVPETAKTLLQPALVTQMDFARGKNIFFLLIFSTVT